MEQPTYQPEPAQLAAKLASLFPDSRDRADATTQLNRYSDFYPETVRVRFAILKLSGGDVDHLEEMVELAMIDYRDVLAAAEYPSYMRLDAGVDPESPEAQQAIRADWAQYNEWAES